jgi:hypothetical protein
VRDHLVSIGLEPDDPRNPINVSGDAAFVAAMNRAIDAGKEKAKPNVQTKPGTCRPVTVNATSQIRTQSVLA